MEIANLKVGDVNQNGYYRNVLTKERIGALFIYPIDYTPDDCLACDGYLLNIDDYEDLYNIIGTKFNANEDADGMFRVPDYNVTGKFLQPGTSVGSQIAAGLPGIELALRIDAGPTTKSYYNNTYLSAYGTDDYGGTMTASTNNSDEYMFQMSNAADNRKAGDLILDTSIYGQSSTVQPSSQIVHICIKYK